MYVCVLCVGAKLKYVWTSQPPSMPLAHYEFRYAHTDERLRGKDKGARIQTYGVDSRIFH